MRRRLTALLAMVVVTVMVAAAPALAAQGGAPAEGSCGFGTFSEDLREDDFNYKKEKISPKPGGGEASELHPTNCPGSA